MGQGPCCDSLRGSSRYVEAVAGVQTVHVQCVQSLVSNGWSLILGVQCLVSNAWCPVLGVQTVQCVQCLLSNGLSPMVGDQWLVSNGWCPNCRTFFAVSCLALITASSIYGLTVPNRNWTLGQIKCQGSPLLYGFLIPLAQQKAAFW